jgi:putative membrane protein
MTSATLHAADRPPTPDGAATPGRVLLAGFLMGVANLVPGVSGGTMILALGLYDTFIKRVAQLTSLRWSRGLFVFLALLAVGLFGALLGLSTVAVWFVTHHRWAAYALFIGMTLGGVPELWRHARPFRFSVGVATAAGFLAMVGLAFGLRDAALPQTTVVFALVGALAASSMILPGVSGSYILLIFGLYDVVVGSLRASALREDLAGSLAIIVPVGVGAAVGIGALSNVLKFVLNKWKAPSHGVLLGLLCGSVLGLWPFQDAVHPELATKDGRKAVERLLAGDELTAVNAEFELELTPADATRLQTEFAGASGGDLKQAGLQLDYYRPGGARIGGALLLLLVGGLLTRRLGAHTED